MWFLITSSTAMYRIHRGGLVIAHWTCGTLRTVREFVCLIQSATPNDCVNCHKSMRDMFVFSVFIMYSIKRTFSSYFYQHIFVATMFQGYVKQYTIYVQGLHQTPYNLRSMVTSNTIQSTF